MSRRLFNIVDGEVVGPRQYYGRIAGRSGVKPRMMKKALKLVDISEETWCQGLAMKDMIIYSPCTFNDWYKQHRVISKLRNVFFKRGSCSRGLKEAYATTIEFYNHRASQGYN